MTTPILDLMQNYEKGKHERRIAIAIGSKFIDMNEFNFMFDPEWPELPTKIPNKISSLIVDSYYHLPKRPDLAFVCLWMAFNSSFHQVAVRESFSTNKNNITDDYGLDCAKDAITKLSGKPVSIDGSVRTLMDILIITMKDVPEKLTSMIATNAVRSISFNLHQCGGRYESKAFKGLKNNFPNLAQLIIDCHGKAYSNIAYPFINLKNREADLIINDPIKSQNIIRSLSNCFQEIFKSGSTIMSQHGTGQEQTINLSQDDRVSLLLRYVLYASRNNISHGKVSSRLNSNTANPESYKSNTYIYVVCYIFLAIMLDNLGYASDVVIFQAVKNIKLIIKKQISNY